MSRNEIQRIRKDLEKHGFTHEIEVSRLLSSKGWTTVNRYYFVDEETTKQREIDCLATKQIREISLEDIGAEVDLRTCFRSFLEKNLWGLRLIIECKKSAKPWVFHTTEPDYLSFLYLRCLGNLPKYLSQRSHIPLKSEGEELSMWAYIFEKLHCSFIKNIRISRNYFEPFTQGKGNRILDAVMKVTKALNYDLRKMRDLIKKMKLTDYLLIYYPIIVFEGNLYELKFEKNQSEIFPIDYLQYSANYANEDYRIEVVTKKFLPKFLEYLDVEIGWLKKILSAN